ncbi:MAG TPA: AgmX/PglI C-terminal domain-containing protein [Polyangiaceae bacterium]|nr:AgmX/PglI C-terminal domain-containing protein [Polyangiaceae bacterium]
MERQHRWLVLFPALAVQAAACGARVPETAASAPTAPARAASDAMPGLALAASEPASLDDPARCEEGADLDLDALEPSAPEPTAFEQSAPDALDASTIRSVVRQHSDGFMGCYQLGLGRDPTLQGRVTTRFAIAPGGKIAELEITANELPDCAVVECIREHFATIEFPPPGSVVTVQYPLVFSHH